MLLAEVIEIKGSAPAEIGARILFDGQVWRGTIGGGFIEFNAKRDGLLYLARADSNPISNPLGLVSNYILGGADQQCCGGSVRVRFSRIGADECAAIKAQMAQQGLRILLGGAGHVGTEVAQLLCQAKIPFDWVEDRPDYYDNAQATLARLKPYGADVGCVRAKIPANIIYDYAIIMTYSHQLDLDICYFLLKYHCISAKILLLGSDAKAKKFAHKLAVMIPEWHSLQSMFECPIGNFAGVHRDKSPFSVALQVMLRLYELKNGRT